VRTTGVGLPLAPLSVPTPAPSLYYTVTPVDARGRLADRSPIRALGWQPGQPITITVLQQSIVVTPQPGGASITRQGHLRLPARIRHVRDLNVGDRLLVAAAPTPGVLVAYTMALLETILLEHHATTSRGAPR
jgi:bifunctional DNA-binding transcriptional regulator/antitoxin component of YhaV-PrlF toxin-antitoxin module